MARPARQACVLWDFKCSFYFRDLHSLQAESFILLDLLFVTSYCCRHYLPLYVQLRSANVTCETCWPRLVYVNPLVGDRPCVEKSTDLLLHSLMINMPPIVSLSVVT